MDEILIKINANNYSIYHSNKAIYFPPIDKKKQTSFPKTGGPQFTRNMELSRSIKFIDCANPQAICTLIFTRTVYLTLTAPKQTIS